MSEGSVYQRADGRWCAKYRDATGKWRYLYRKTKSAAKKAPREALKDRDDNIIPADKLTLNDALDAWLESIRDSVSLRTWTNRESLVRIHLRPHQIGSKRLRKLTADDLRRFYREKLKHLSPATVGRLHDVIKKACKEQLRLKRIRANPAADVRPPKSRERAMEVLTPEQVRTLLDTVRGNRWEAVYVLGATCGLRVGEALSLRYEDLDLTEGTISIRRTLWRYNVYPPKTPQSRRTLKLPRIALEALKKHCEANGKPLEGWLFPTRHGNPTAPETFWRWGWKVALRRAGLPESLHYHDLRHGAASLLLSQNVPILVVSRYLGHADPGVTMRVYAHMIDGTSGMAAQGMDAALG
jgi:integrase